MDAAKQNPNCVDCNAIPVTHISVQNGVTLCSDCATLHSEQLTRELVSWVRPIESQWRDDQLVAIRNGGNDRFTEFMSSFDLYTEARYKYTSEPAQHYRQYISTGVIPELKMTVSPVNNERTTSFEEQKVVYEVVQKVPSPKLGHRVVSFWNKTKETYDKTPIKQSFFGFGNKIKAAFSDVGSLQQMGNPTERIPNEPKSENIHTLDFYEHQRSDLELAKEVKKQEEMRAPISEQLEL